MLLKNLCIFENSLQNFILPYYKLTIHFAHNLFSILLLHHSSQITSLIELILFTITKGYRKKFINALLDIYKFITGFFVLKEI